MIKVLRLALNPSMVKHLFTTAARWAVVVIESKSCLIDCLIDLPTFSQCPTRATRDIVVEGDMLDELEEVITL